MVTHCAHNYVIKILTNSNTTIQTNPQKYDTLHCSNIYVMWPVDDYQVRQNTGVIG